jgi:hypothetical protein
MIYKRWIICQTEEQLSKGGGSSTVQGVARS